MPTSTTTTTSAARCATSELTHVEQLARDLRKALAKSTAGKQVLRNGYRYTLLVTDGEFTALDGTIVPRELRPLLAQLLEELPPEPPDRPEENMGGT